MWVQRGGLRRRIVLAVTLGMSVILLSFGVISYYIINKSIEDSLNNKLALGRLVRNKIDDIIKNNINRLYDISLSGAIHLDDNDLNPERHALDTAYRYSMFTDGIFLLDRDGNTILQYPEKIKNMNLNLLSIAPVSRVVATGKPVVSNLYTSEVTKRKVLFMLVPLKDKNGDHVGIAGGEIDPTNPVFTEMIRIVDMKGAFIDLVDSNGMIIASSNPQRAFTHCDKNEFFSSIIASKKERVATCHQCHDLEQRKKTTNVVAVVPFDMAPWGISIQEPEEDIFAPSIQLKKAFALLAIIFLGTAFMLAVGISRGVVNPVKTLITGADRIAKGDLSMPVPVSGSDEIGSLGQSFETMRVKLAESLEDIRNHNLELENRVIERTREIRESRKKVESLLKRIISAQEEERRRIARELHDDTIQNLTAVLMNIDICKLYPEEITEEKIERIRRIILQSLEELKTTIHNLRPTILDDLGLEAAIKWLLETHLKERGLSYSSDLSGISNMVLHPVVQINIFKIVQETVMNIVRHANARNVVISAWINNKSFHTSIEDDGDGFDTGSLLLKGIYYEKDGKGLGLLGMKERASLIDARLDVCSQPGSGTIVTLDVPMKVQEVSDV